MTKPSEEVTQADSTPTQGTADQPSSEAAPAEKAPIQNHSGHDKEISRKRLMGLTIAAVGVVFGDIGTSPLYTMKEVFSVAHGLALTHDNVLGILSLIFWSLTSVVTLKYVMFIMRADNRGEGGIMALTALALRTMNASPRKMWLLTALGMFGAALFYGDGVITPAISVLSAMEGMSIASESLTHFVVPATIVVLIFLFVIQSKGTASVGALFGPVMVAWFVALGTFGVMEIVENPSVLAAFNPWYAINFFINNRIHGFLSLGSVVLAVTGAEALYADMGHFGRKPIKMAWFFLVLPCIYLNYLGQGALILNDPSTIRNPFYLLVPNALLYPMLGLATFATIIASQAVISGAFSLTRQAMQLGYCPRIAYVHTSSHEIGQIYVGGINWMLLAAVIALVVGFGSSDKLASAYGIAVTLTMMIDTILAFIVIRNMWSWKGWQVWLFLIGFLFVDFSFFSANVPKVLEGGWFPLLLGGMVFLLLSTWKKGRALLTKKVNSETMPLDIFIPSLSYAPPHRVDGMGIFMTSTTNGVPRALLHNLLHNKVLHETVVLVTVTIEDIPTVSDEDRCELTPMESGFYRLIVRYGFKDEPDIPAALGLCVEKGLDFELMQTTFFLGRERLVPHARPGMMVWRERLFFFMHRNASNASDFFKIPANRVIEFGTKIEI